MKNLLTSMLDKYLSDKTGVFERKQEFGFVCGDWKEHWCLILSKTKDNKYYIEHLVSLDRGTGYRGNNCKYSYNEMLEELDELFDECGSDVAMTVVLIQYDYYVGRLESSDLVHQNTNKPSYVKIINENGTAYPNLPSLRTVTNEYGEEVEGISIPEKLFGYMLEYAGTIKE